MTNRTYRIALANHVDFDLAGKGNLFHTPEDAQEAADSMNKTRPVDGDEWVVFEY